MLMESLLSLGAFSLSACWESFSVALLLFILFLGSKAKKENKIKQVQIFFEGNFFKCGESFDGMTHPGEYLGNTPVR